MKTVPVAELMADGRGRDAIGLGRMKSEGLDARHGTILSLEDINVSFDGF
ncbi:MAG TPA: ABC transporter ATP-binding protein, partial [Pseudomonas nitrititolerans]|nr:ABC transporter ATP-binding protein [Stutzerimonas nitrititolerans]